MNNKQTTIYNWLVNNPGLHTSNEIALGVNMSEFSVHATLRGLMTNGFVVMELMAVEINEMVSMVEGYTVK